RSSTSDAGGRARPGHFAAWQGWPMRVALFVTCLVDLVLPEVGVATARVLQRAGHEVVFPERQTCCGQPAFNSGQREEAAHMLRELGLEREPRAALERLEGVELADWDAGRCCGFGGTFAVRQPELSVAMADEKLRTLGDATTLCGADPSCLMHLRGRLRRLG